MRGWTGSLVMLAVAVVPGWAEDEGSARFETAIRPVLAGTCFRCHGGKKVGGGLRVDSREALLTGGDRGPAVVPGDPEASLIVSAIGHADDLKMPPDRRLPDSALADFSAWIREGAPWPSAGPKMTEGPHWAFQAIRRPVPPEDPSGWAFSPIDRFVSAGLRAKGLRPVAEADRRTLLRRLSFDVIGLPPTSEEMAAFLADEAPDAWERQVERLLASPRYGERWGRRWMDVAHYADTAGDNADYPVPEARLYRDWIIDALNADMPYDRFVRDQVAGDLFAEEAPPEQRADRVVATTFLGLSRRYATAPYELWHLSIEDAIDTTGRAFLGLTLRCARCHDHKFDPVTTAEYYSLYGVFASTKFAYTGSEELASKGYSREGFVPLAPADDAMEVYRRRVADLTAALPGVSHAETAAILGDELRLLKRLGRPSSLSAAYGVSEASPTDVAIQRGGDPEQPGPVVARGAPTFLASVVPPPEVPADSSGRRELAEWMTRPEHPLTARVLVNRIWQGLFGRGIVATPSNFGRQGAEPTHPELLDWLASDFLASGWSMKAVHRRILNSKTYRLSSEDDPASSAIDPANAWLWRHSRRRLDAEGIRDALLIVSGRLDPSRGGDHPFPPIGSWGWTQHSAFREVYRTDRRTVYLMTQRLVKHPFLALFDGPDTNTSTESRTTSTVPSQALYLLNNPEFARLAEGFADRLIASEGDEARRLELAYEIAWSRRPSSEEAAERLAWLDRYAEMARGTGQTEEASRRLSWMALARVMLTANEFFYVD